MEKSFAAICEALARVRLTEPELTARLSVRIFGTYSYWKEGDPRPLQAIARRFGLADLVDEYPARVTYGKAIELAAGSDGLLVLGVDDPGYVPSKLFTYAVSGNPLLASLRADSAARRFFDDVPELGNVILFDDQGVSVSENGLTAMRAFLRQVRRRQRFDRRSSLADFLAPAMAAKHVALFERICSDNIDS